MKKSSTCRCLTTTRCSTARRSTCMLLEIGLALMGPNLRPRQSLVRTPLARLFPNKGHGPQKLSNAPLRIRWRAPRACLAHLGASYTVGARATCHINEFIEHALVYIISQNRKLSRSKPLFTPFLPPIRPYLDINHFSVLDWAHIT